jgi:hypothetical protein
MKSLSGVIVSLRAKRSNLISIVQRNPALQRMLEGHVLDANASRSLFSVLRSLPPAFSLLLSAYWLTNPPLSDTLGL